mgnify:CR=1 FL=1
MTPSARCQAAIELLETIESSSRPADAILQSYFRKRRYVGGGDRRAIQSLVYAVLRKQAQLDWWCHRAGIAPNVRQRVLAALSFRIAWEGIRLDTVFAGDRYGAQALDGAENLRAEAWLHETIENDEQPDDVRLNYPAWLNGAFSSNLNANLEAELQALNSEATVDLRVNSLKTDRDTAIRLLADAGLNAVPMKFAPNGIRLSERRPFRHLQGFKDGLFEPQDEASQIAAELVGAAPGDRVLDFCAGGGGKALALAAVMENRGQIVLHDVDEKRLAEAERRLERAGVTICETREKARVINDEFDIVILDAPCSGSGVWRRNPETKWRITPALIAQQTETQAAILAEAAHFVRPGGRLAYMTCSVLEAENKTQVDKFLRESLISFNLITISKEISKMNRLRLDNADEMLQLTPRIHQTDGFFVALFERHSE